MVRQRHSRMAYGEMGFGILLPNSPKSVWWGGVVILPGLMVCRQRSQLSYYKYIL